MMFQTVDTPVHFAGITGEDTANTCRSTEKITGLTRQNSAYRRIIRICEQVATAALQGADVRELTSILAKIIQKTIVLLDPTFELRCHAVGHGCSTGNHEWDPGDPVIARLLDSLATEHLPLRVPAIPDSVLAHDCLATPIMLGDTILGYLFIIDSSNEHDLDDGNLLIASYVATLFALPLAHERTSTDLGRRYQAAIVDSLVSGHFLDPEDARRKIHILGLGCHQQFRVAVIRAQVDQLRPPSLTLDEVDELIEAITGSVVGAVGATRNSSLVVILPEDPEGTAPEDQIAVRIRTAMSTPRRRQSWSNGTRPTCGLSESTRWPDKAPLLFQQAETAIEIGTRIGRAGQVIAYDSLGIYKLLLQIGDLHQLRQFAEDVLGPVIDYDASHKVDLVRTLSVYLSQRDSLKRTARRLQVHTNTVSYRIQRIEQLSRLDLTNPDDQLLAHIAIKIINAQRADNQPDQLSDVRCQ